MRSVRVEWEGLFSIDKVLELNDKNKDFGIYQIYGTHIIFGKKALLYIGQTYKGETDRTFSQRFHEEHTVWLKEEEDVSIHVGRIKDCGIDKSNLRQVIKNTEALTIKWHPPPYNSKNIETYNGERLEVVNRGIRGSLDKRYKSRDRKKWGYPGDYY
jgi:hypothetical protein